MGAEKVIEAVGIDWLAFMAVMFGFVLWWAFRKPGDRDGESGGSDGDDSGSWYDGGDGDGGGD